MSTAAADPSDVTTTDVVVIGAGVAGLSAALGVAPHRVTLLTKGRLGSSGSSPLAQGGVAAALGPDDGPDLHARDTLEAGGGLCEPALVEILTGAAAYHIERLATLGTRFDRDTDGRFALGREAAHGRSRILHANGDGTGAEVVRALGAAVGRAEHVRLEEDAVAEDLLVTDGRVGGVFVRRRDGSRVLHLARSTVVATGGTARLWRDIRLALDSLSLPTVAEVMRSIRSRAAAGLTGGYADVPLADRLLRYVRSLMWRNVGLVRTETGLRHALTALEAASLEAGGGDARNAVLVARLLTIAALARKESRGGHFRADFPDPSPHEARRRHLQLRPGDRVEPVGSFEPFQLPTAKIHATVGGHASASLVFRLQR